MGEASGCDQKVRLCTCCGVHYSDSCCPYRCLSFGKVSFHKDGSFWLTLPPSILLCSFPTSTLTPLPFSYAYPFPISTLTPLPYAYPFPISTLTYLPFPCVYPFPTSTLTPLHPLTHTPTLCLSLLSRWRG